MSKPYCPPNGSEGEYFMDRYCFRCWYDRNEDCAILADSLYYKIDDPDYPTEWIEDSEGARCTRFAAVEPKILPADEAAQLAFDMEVKS